MLIQFSATNPYSIGYAEVSNAPNIPALPDDLWLDFLNFHYCYNLPLNPTNTCFLNKFVFNNSYNPEMIKQLLCEIFYRENKLRYIVVAECPDYRRYPEKDNQNYSCLEAFSMIFYPKCFSVISCANTQKIHVIMRDSVLPQMRYRKALPEDNDDIVDVIDHDRPDLKEQLGEYYIAEELLSDAKSLLIVTEINNITAGFIWLNDNIRLLPLLENYNLQAFGNLLKFNTQERFKEKLLYVTTAKKRPLEKLFTTESVNQIYKGVGEITNMENISNLSICSHRIESHEGRIVAVNEKRFMRELILKRWEELNEQIKSYDYYVQLRRRQFGFYYNIPDGQTHASYDSRSNVFVIQLFGLVGSHDPRRIFRFLLTAFAAFPNKDYCLLSISVANHMTLALFEMLKYFIRVTPRPDCRIDEQLFITHRSAVYGDISVFPLRPQDVDDIKTILKEESSNSYTFPKRTARSRISTIADRISFKSYLSQRSDSYEELTANQYDLQQVSDILKSIFKDPFSVYKCFTIRCGDSTRSEDDNKLVGFVIVRPFHLSYYLRKHYHVNNGDEFQNFFKAELVILKLHHFFCFQADLIFHELARQTNYYYFYYFRSTDRNYLSNDLVASMQPLEPRRIQKLWFNILGKDFKAEISPSASDINKKMIMINTDLLNDHFAVFTHNLRPSINFGNSTNIVILGFTDICKAFLRLMIFSWHNLSKNSQATTNCLPQLNITVICSPGIMEADHEHAFKCKTCSKDRAETCWVNFKNSDAFIRDVCERMDVRTWIRFVSGKIKTINTENQLIKVESECEIYYEILLIMCATEFGVPERIFKDAATPPNYSHINNRFDKILFYHKLQILCNDLPKNLKKSIIVYGNHVRAFEFINFLLKHDIKGREIHLVMPYLMDNLQMGLMLNNSAQDTGIETVLREMLEDLEVQIYEDMILNAYSLHDDDENLKDISFKKYLGNEKLTLECDMFVSFYEVFLPGPLLEIFKNADIDTDHNFVLVNENYQTSEPNIYAMGNFIKHTTEPNHQYRFVSTEEAAEKIINILDLIDTKENAPRLEKKFSKPSYFQAQLPMDYLFIKVTTPKRYLANHLDNEYGFPLVTYNEGDFSRVRLNEHGMVEEIVVVTQKKINFDFLKFFCGRHELLLNNLKSRWYLKDIVNFVDFFQEPWTELLMHEQFENLRLINKLLIMDTAKEILKKDIDRNNRRKLMYSYCQDLGITSQVEYALLEFLRDHREDFYTDIALPEDFATN
ncbi:cilia- and flagella-associated protein 61-like [Calliphora vicina]|uniref:cilia- and flagella-associated protein 61-like n=1 Tax=Calliphora vicina TaxID=7373 RepID=UPI00325AC8D5